RVADGRVVKKQHILQGSRGLLPKRQGAELTASRQIYVAQGELTTRNGPGHSPRPSVLRPPAPSRIVSPRMTRSLMISVAGVRGVVGDSLTPPVLIRFAEAFARGLEPGPVVVGRDARRSGVMVQRAVAAGLLAAGRDVVNLGLATTPTTQLAVEHMQAAGGIILTASHNPAPWNALKFLSPLGEFLDEAAGRALRERMEASHPRWVTHEQLGTEREEYTRPLGVQVALTKTAGPVVTNLSTSRIVDAVCSRFGVPLYRAPVGEANVVAEMKARGAVAGGEGNGGMILPAAHYGRDG